MVFKKTCNMQRTIINKKQEAHEFNSKISLTYCFQMRLQTAEKRKRIKKELGRLSVVKINKSKLAKNWQSCQNQWMRLSQSTELSSLCHKENSHFLSVLCIVIYMIACYSLNQSHSLLPPMCPQVCSLHLHLHCCPVNGFIRIAFLDSICMSKYAIFVFLFLTYFTLYIKLQVHLLPQD